MRVELEGKSDHKKKTKNNIKCFSSIFMLTISAPPLPPFPFNSLIRTRLRQLNSNSEGLINLISYEDAAMAVVAALDAGLKKASAGEAGDAMPEIKGRVFLAADDEPTSRRTICELAMSHPRHSRKLMPKFLLDESPSGFAGAGAKKVYDSSVTRRDLGWEPRHPSMDEYFKLAVKAAQEAEEERVPQKAA